MTPLAFSSSLGDDWSSIKNFLSSGEKSTTLTEAYSHVQDAHLIYLNIFQVTAIEVDSDSDVLIETAFDNIIRNLTSEDYEMISLNKQVIDKTIYKIAYMKMELAIEKNNADDFITWYSVLNKKFKVSEKDYDSNKWISEIESIPSTLSSNGPAILEQFAEEKVEIDIFQYFDEIDRLLNEAKISYRSGDIQAALDAVTFAYLDNYEFIEGPLGEIDHDLMEKIETDMRDDLRNMIKSKVSADEVDVQIDMIMIDLTAAKKVVPEFGTIAMMILAVAIISIVAVTAKSRVVPRF